MPSEQSAGELTFNNSSNPDRLSKYHVSLHLFYLTFELNIDCYMLSTSKQFLRKQTFDLTDYPQRKLGSYFSKLLASAAPGSTIKLPAGEILVPNLLIDKNLKIEG